MTAQQAAQRIHERAWVGQKPGLERTRELLYKLGNPQESLKFVHIAGTNGKGSTAAMTAAILTASHLKTGLFTSPHLWNFQERFQIDGVPMPDDILVSLTERVLAVAEEMEEQPTEFELMTAIGMLYFSSERCDIVVLEVGLGGRMDSTNIIPAPEVAVVTNIGLEHTQQLGNTLAAIAGEKAGIIKAGCTCVHYHQTDEVMEVVQKRCEMLGVPLVITDPDSLVLLEQDITGSTFTYRGYGEFKTQMLGQCQLKNAAVALDISWALEQKGYPITLDTMKEGLSNANWAGRMELVRQNPYVILDGGHNPQCIQALRAALDGLFPNQKLIFITGVLGDKDYQDMIDQMVPISKAFYTVTPDSERALSAQTLAQLLQSREVSATPTSGLAQAIELALQQAGKDDCICLCGSLYMVGEARHIFGLC